MNDDDDEQANGRKPPPVAYRYLPGHSGNLLGRRKGSISRKRLTRKVALERHSVPIDDRQQQRTSLELVILTARGMAMAGHFGAGKIADWLDEQVRTRSDEPQGGLVIVPQGLTNEEWAEQAAQHNALHRHEPGSPESYRWKEERPSAPPPVDPASPLGIALREFEHKWGDSAPEPTHGS